MKEPGRVTREAAAWEVLRRHPTSEGLLAGTCTTDAVLMTHVAFFIKVAGLRAWPTLEDSDQKSWKIALESLPPQHGICYASGDEVSVVFGPTGDNSHEFHQIQELLAKYWNWASGDPNADPKDGSALNTAERLWNRIAKKQGFFLSTWGKALIGFDPFRPGIEKLVAREVKKLAAEARRQRGTPASVGKAYFSDWLETIRAFEKAELQRTPNVTRDDQLFYRYRKMIGSWKLPLS